MEMDSYYEITRTSDFIRRGKFTRVALQFPDELLKDSTKVVSLLRSELVATKADDGVDKNVGLFVLADTTFGSCCVDEVGAAHINADCVIHYGHTCLSPTSTLPAFFVFGKAPINTLNCVEKLLSYASTVNKPVMVLYGLEYVHAMLDIKEATRLTMLKKRESLSNIEIFFADANGSAINPSQTFDDAHENLRMGDTSNNNDDPTVIKYKIGGLTWNIPVGTKMEDYILFWIGSENPAFANVVMTFNSCDIVRYDADKDHLVTDFSHQKRILKRRYFIVEKAKDANMVGILVGTLGVAGYLSMIDQMKELVTGAGKKAYTLAMGRPNPAKLANFPECDVFIYVSCAQTALLDSKEFMAPIITPYEAMLAFKSGSQWTGAYVMEFRDLVSSPKTEHKKPAPGEARFSFFQGGYVEDQDVDDDDVVEEDSEAALVALASATEKVLQIRNDNDNNHNNRYNSVVKKKTANSGAEYLAMRSYQGLDLDGQDAVPDNFIVGRSGRASGYATEKDTNRG